MTHEELMRKAQEAKSVQELLEAAAENGIELTKENAEEYYAQMNKTGELSDDELDNVAGGAGCPQNDSNVVSPIGFCDGWTCMYCGGTYAGAISDIHTAGCRFYGSQMGQNYCSNCKFKADRDGKMICTRNA